MAVNLFCFSRSCTIGICYEVVPVWEINWTSSSHNYSVIEEMKNKHARRQQKKASVKMIIHRSSLKTKVCCTQETHKRYSLVHQPSVWKYGLYLSLRLINVYFSFWCIDDAYCMTLYSLEKLQARCNKPKNLQR